jgi:ATP-dependent DNA helicase RecG
MIFPHVTEEHLLLGDLMPLARSLAVSCDPDHPWKDMSDMDILTSTNLYDEDPRTGERGFNLAAVLIFGRSNVIQQVAPGFLTDCLLRIDNVDRYDKRIQVSANLIESFGIITDFIAKHTDNPLRFINDQKVSPRDQISKEIVSNMIIHREFGHAFPASVVIEKDRIITANWNRSSLFSVRIDPRATIPIPKNPILARFFVNIGYADIIGAGMRNLLKHTKLLSGREPELYDGNIFQTIIPLAAADPGTKSLPMGSGTRQTEVGLQTKEIKDEKLEQLLLFCAEPRTRAEMQNFYGMAFRNNFCEYVLQPLLDTGRLKRTEPDKLKSPYQKYVSAQN